MSSIKHALKTHTPFASKLLPIYHKLRESFTALRLKLSNRADTFTRYYRSNKWQDKDSRSGEGSNFEQTRIIREALPAIIKKYKIESMLDIPCGDFFWMQNVDLGGVDYIGSDIVAPMIEKNNAQYVATNRSFVCLDMCEDTLPKTDLIHCRDALVHLSFADIEKALRNFKASGARYLLTTTFTDRDKNEDIITGMWRTLNLELAPFHFPTPLEIHNEDYTAQDGRYQDKCIALWDLNELDLKAPKV